MYISRDVDAVDVQASTRSGKQGGVVFSWERVGGKPRLGAAG